MTAAEVREQLSMWDVLDLLEVDYDRGAGECFIYSWLRDERTPSVHVNDTLWYDFGAGVGGGVIEFVQSYLGTSFGRAVKLLARQSGSSLTSIRHTPPAPKVEEPPPDFWGRFFTEGKEIRADSWLAKKILEKHGIGLSTMNAFGLRAGPGESLWIPHFHGETLPMVKVRDYAAGVRKNFKGSKAMGLYRPSGRHWLGAPTLIVEGESDAWAAWAHGLNPLALPAGAGKWEPGWFKDVPRDAYVCGDNDSVGEASAQRLVAEFGFRRVQVPAEYKDLCEFHMAGVGTIGALLGGAL